MRLPKLSFPKIHPAGIRAVACPDQPSHSRVPVHDSAASRSWYSGNARQRRKQGREARSPQGLVGLAGHPAEPLDGSHRVVTDTVDGKENMVSAADKSRDQPRAVFDSAVVMQETRSGPFG